MDKQAFIGIFLIMIVTLIWMFTMEPQRPPQTTPFSDSTYVERTLPQNDSTATAPVETAQPVEPPVLSERPSEEFSSTSQEGIASDTLETVIHIENQFVRATISNQHGGRLTHWELKKYDYFFGGQVDLVAGHGVPNVEQRGLNVEFVGKNGNVRLTDYSLSTELANDASIFLDENNPTTELEFYLPIESGRIVKKYIFSHDKYSVDVLIGFENLDGFIAKPWYTLKWENGLPSSEDNIQEDFDYARSYIHLGGELEDLDVSDGEDEKLEKSGKIDWVGVRSKYFLSAIVPHEKDDLSATLSGIGYEKNDAVIKIYNAALGINIPPASSASHYNAFTLYLGPLTINDLEPYDVGLENLVMSSSSYENFFRPISRWIVLPSFTFLHNYIPNYGWVIIVFSILVKILLHPLTKKSYQSMGAMQTLQPKMTELREKYKNEPQRLNKEMMKLYKEEGINPLGGCLPMLLQMPLLFALFIVFRSTIQLRGEPFIAWITDLSRPDTLSLGFTIPFLGDSIHILPFLMGATMIWQSKMTITDPKQKPMMMIMPVFLTFIFYSFPSGLNLYYAVFNLLSMFQTRMIKKKAPDEGTKTNHKPTKPAKPAAKTKSTKKPSLSETIAQMSHAQKSKKKKKRNR